MPKLKNPFPSIMTDESYAAMQARMTWNDICRKAHKHTVETQPAINEQAREQRLREMERKTNPVLGY